mmetsp:Transcript_271/g.367  ORF Transcript_271/g.367 Transcript_271/m.367 type:complete len:301 (-) Transcript_271:223-1125(-)
MMSFCILPFLFCICIFHYAHGYLSVTTNKKHSLFKLKSTFHKFHTINSQTVQLQLPLSLSKSSNDPNNENIPSFIETIVLQQVYPAMMKHIEEYGNPNIPLGTTDGKKCKTLRRMAFQNKLTEKEMELLEGMSFRLNNLEDVYEEADFDECLERLLKYEKEFGTNYQIPKKYKPDPELGAWVTMIRRIGRDDIEEERRNKLDQINFAWISTRKCGSVFMSSYRTIKGRLEECCNIPSSSSVKEGSTKIEVIDHEKHSNILKEEKVAQWIKAQKLAADLGNLSEHRCEYMDSLPGLNWREF